jgi:hypothetical protein
VRKSLRPHTTQRSRAGLRAAVAALGAAVFVALAPLAALACEPCGSRLDLPRSLEKAELVVVARRPAEPKQPEGPANGPACDVLSVEGVLKGEFKGEKLRVRSWYGMCPYGIILSEGTYVVLLSKAPEHAYDVSYPDDECAKALKRKPELYVAVEQGCAVKALAVREGSVEAEGLKMTLEEFRDKYGLRGAGAPGAGAAAVRRFGAWPGGYFGAGLFGPAAAFREVTQ